MRKENLARRTPSVPRQVEELTNLDCLQNLTYVSLGDRGYDATFLLKILKDYNIKVNYEYYRIRPIFKDHRILKLDISVKNPSGKNSKITLMDSYNILPRSLDVLSRSFNVEHKKGIFPHTFVSANTLNYVGNTPDISYFSSGRKVLDQTIYNSIFSTN